MGWISDLLRGGGDELGWDDLVRRIVDAVAGVRQYGPKGEVVFPDDLAILIAGPENTIAIVQGFLERPELDREVVAAVANRCDVAASDVPAREYLVETAERVAVTATAGAPKTLRLVIHGGDLDGTTLPLAAGWSELAFGRGPWHGGDHGARNDLIVCDKTEFVSRRAGRLYRAGNQVEVASLDQADELIVRRATGETVRPARTARGRALVKAGDAIELGDGRTNVVRLVLERV